MNTAKILLEAHRGFAYLELLIVSLFIIALIVVAIGYSGRINNFLRKSALFTMIVFHIQFLIGIIMLLGTSGFRDTIQSMGMGELMKNADLRFTYIEHPFSMLIAAILMTVVHSKLKKNTLMQLSIMILSIVALLLFFYAIPFNRLFFRA